MNTTSSSNTATAGTDTVIAQASSSSSTAAEVVIAEGGGEEILSDDDDDMGGSSSDSTMEEDGGGVGGEVQYVAVPAAIASQLASAGTTGMAAAAAISSTKKRKRSTHSFETNPSIRKRQQTRLLRKLRHNIEEYSLRVGQQACVVVACPGSKHQNNFRAFGAKPLEDVVKNLRSHIMSELEASLARQAPPEIKEDPSLHELPPLVVDGIPTPVEKMTQAQLRAFIPLMLKYSTGRGKPGWGKESTMPSWWPRGVPWANVRMDARREDEKQRVSWTHALRQIVVNCYRFHEREDLLPVFSAEEKGVTVMERKLLKVEPNVHYSSATVLQTVTNSDGSVSIFHAEPNSQVITLPDGSQAQLSGFEPGQPGVHTLAEVATATAAANEQRQIQVIQQQQQEAAAAAAAQQEAQQQTATAIEINGEIAGTGDGNIIIAGEDGQAYAVPVGSGGVILGSGGNVYQVVHQNPRPAAAAAGAAEEEESTTTTTTTQTVQIISGSQLQAINGQIVTRTAQQEREQEQREAEAAVTASESAEASAVTTSQQQSGLTITPVSVAAAAARSQQTVALSGVQPGQIIQIVQSGGGGSSGQGRRPLILAASSALRHAATAKAAAAAAGTSNGGAAEGPSSSSG